MVLACVLTELVVQNGSFLEAILKNLRCQENDYSVLFALGLLHAISTNSGSCSSLRPHLLNDAFLYY